MADVERDQKTEAPTPKRRQEAAEKGDVLQSRELGTAMGVLAGAGWLVLAGPWMLGACREMLARGLTFDNTAVTDFSPGIAFARLAGAVVLPLASLFAVTIAAAIGTPALLGSLGFRWSAIGFKGGKLNPLTGLQRIFSAQGLIELGKSIVKVILLGAVAYWLLASQAGKLAGLGRQDIQPALGDLGHMFVLAVVVMALALAAIAGLDVPMQIMQRTKRLRMSKQEVRDEHKQAEGSPENKSAQKRRAREILSGAMRKAIPQATVVLTNPTHFAVALRYRPGFDAAPVVVAKGKDEVAAAIRTLADEHAVPILSYPQLTRALYFTARAGDVIREDLFIAVATILAFVFNLDRAMADGTPQPQVDVPPAARFDENGATAS